MIFSDHSIGQSLVSLLLKEFRKSCQYLAKLWARVECAALLTCEVVDVFLRLLLTRVTLHTLDSLSHKSHSYSLSVLSCRRTIPSASSLCPTCSGRTSDQWSMPLCTAVGSNVNSKKITRLHSTVASTQSLSWELLVACCVNPKVSTF